MMLNWTRSCRLDAADFYGDAAVARDALAHRRQFNVSRRGTACKVDLIIRKTGPSAARVDRRQHVDVGFGRHLAM